MLFLALFLLISSCSDQQIKTLQPQEIKMKREKVIIDDDFIATKDIAAIIHPVWFTANIYGSYTDYETSLARFSRSQRLVHAAEWYQAEVHNGGHDQFYSNSTGIVWEDARTAFTEFGLPEVAEIIGESAKRMGGQPSFDRDERNDVLDAEQPNFDDLDDRFYKLTDIDPKILDYIRKRPKDFLFSGEVEIPAAQ